jgi:aspartate/methionine/tyrosine aminotransferase
MDRNDPLSFFRLKPIQVARVSEISETTAAAPVPAEERVNFHIGNPLQDERLSSAFLRIALGVDVRLWDLRDSNPDAFLDYLGWPNTDKPRLELLIRTIQKSSPYMPRGGYSRKNPNALIKIFCSWLEKQQEPLTYDTGESSGRREIILASGGINETLRILFFALSAYLQVSPARILSYRHKLPQQLKIIPHLLFTELEDDEDTALGQIQQACDQTPAGPIFILVGGLMGEAARRRLRSLSVAHPIFFVEVNNAPNHLSLAREAKLVQRVVRLLTPGIFMPRWDALPTVFIAGNADFLNVLENVHFNMKGTPSASEVEFLTYLLEHEPLEAQDRGSPAVPEVKPFFEGLGLSEGPENTLPQLANQAQRSLDDILKAGTDRVDRWASRLEEKTTELGRRIQRSWTNEAMDEFASVNARDLLDLFIQNVHDPLWRQSLERGFLSAFTRQQSQYRAEACTVVSGSSRTALGILGFHCGIEEVVIADLSWSYEQCFPTVHTVPLTESLDLDADGMIGKVGQLLHEDPSWSRRGAVVINNPHNATGKTLNEAAIRKLISYSLHHGLYVIDDLAYQNVVPANDLPDIKTVRQITTELEFTGEVSHEQAARVITVHSMSKTDCLAGARLSVVEIQDQELRNRFEELNQLIRPNWMAIFICYLFYRNTKESVRAYWQLRNAIFAERTRALVTAENNLSPDRNPYELKIIPPTGSMYPLLQVGELPNGISLDWLASSLARRGIGLLPLATFARTEAGFEIGRTTFRLTLGGVDNAESLQVKTRRLLIDLNRLIGEEDARYNRRNLVFHDPANKRSRSGELSHRWAGLAQEILQAALFFSSRKPYIGPALFDGGELKNRFLHGYGPERLDVFRRRLLDRAATSDELVYRALNDNGDWLEQRLAREFMKDSLSRRQELFRMRSYDRTVHPTQMYSLEVERAMDAIIAALVSGQPVEAAFLRQAGLELWREFLGRNVSINSEQEAGEILLDLNTLIMGEEYAEAYADLPLPSILSFWSDWDGSNRPSGQGHRLAASVVMENVRRLSSILNLLRSIAPGISMEPDLIEELGRLPQRNLKFLKLLNDITLLTQQLEQRYRGVLPFSIDSTSWQRLATRLHLRRDSARVLWLHNDRYEKKMLELRQERRRMLEYYFGLNKQLRKQLFALIGSIRNNRLSEPLLRSVVGYRDILQRTVITPRIHQSMVMARDQFAIDTTVYNMHEVNAISGMYGNPGMALALQISFSSKPEALISLDRMMHSQAELVRREHPQVELPSIWLIPLFEELETVRHIRDYLEQVWAHAVQSRTAAQSVQARFAEIIPEVFLAGSDLSQQVGQAAGSLAYLKTKHEIHTWLAERGVSEALRVKLGSGEPMQRQGGYYSPVAGQAAFLSSDDSHRRYSAFLPPPARKSTDYAVTPLQGVFLGGDLRTFQSNLSEKLRYLPAREYVELLFHVKESQREHRGNLIRAAETIAESRLSRQGRGAQELERLILGQIEAPYERFLEEYTENFRQILYGRQEDVVGLHVISYFIGRSIPQLRDRPTSRRLLEAGVERGQQIIANIAKIIPLAKQGSLLRAIAHNQAQTVVLGINQLTTGLFRALDRYSQKAFEEAERDHLVAVHLLPHLPVYEILSTLRIYQDNQGDYFRRIEKAFPAGNSAFAALREDLSAMEEYLPLFQQELLRRHGVSVNDFFSPDGFIPELLPTLRPDLAVLMQRDLFNSDIDQMLDQVTGAIDSAWREEAQDLLLLPQKIGHFRSIIWEVLEESVFSRVQSFAELATALYSFSAHGTQSTTSPGGRGARLSPTLAGFFRTARPDDEMRSFLVDAIEYLNSYTEGNLEVPVSIIRAFNDVERIAQIEESSLPGEKQDILRDCLLQIARLTGENG